MEDEHDNLRKRTAGIVYGYYTGNCVNMQVKRAKFKKSSEESIKLKRNERKGEI